MHNSTQFQPSLEELLTNIRGWGHARNLIEGATPQTQFLKLMEEIGEVYEARNQNDMMDAIGDSIVVLTIMAAQCGRNLEDIINDASYGVGSALEVRLHGNIGQLFDALSEVKPDELNDTALNLIELNGHMIVLIELLSSLASKLARNKREEAISLIGQVALEITMVSDKSELDFIDCINMAWNEIKDRKGRMVDGVFIKEADYTATPAH